MSAHASAAPASPHFTALELTNLFGINRSELPTGLRTPGRYEAIHGEQTIRGIPFLFGGATGPNVVLLDSSRVTIGLGGATATYVLFVHVVEDAAEGTGSGWARDDADGDRLGTVVSEYVLEYEDGSNEGASILRRFAIQQARCAWGSAPFACVPAAEFTLCRPRTRHSPWGGSRRR
jgi:hypothetical protein